MRPGRRAASRGLGLIFALLTVAVVSAGAMLVATDWTQQMQREKEAELLRVGDLYARAIASYYFSTPGPVKRFPPDLQSLLEDRRLPVPRRHLRSAYSDPVAGGDWGVVLAPDGGIMGVHSRSERITWRRTALVLDHATLPAAQRYADWKFLAKVS